MAIETSIVVEFGEDVQDTGDIVVIEFDEDHSNNLNSDGDVKSTFAPAEQPVFMIHHANTVLISDVRCTDGSVAQIGSNITKERESEVLFTTEDTEINLNYFNPFLTSSVFYGNQADVVINNSTVQFVSGVTPCLGDITFNVLFNREYMLTPPPLTLVGDEVYKIVVVVYVTKI